MKRLVLNSVMALGISAIIVIISGPILLPVLKNLRWGQRIRLDGPKLHLDKAGTPTMGGIMFLVSTSVASLIFGGREPAVYIILAAMWAYGLVGFADDYQKVVFKRSLGLKARHKIIAQVGISMGIGLLAVGLLGREPAIILPWNGESIFLGWPYLLFILIVFVGTTNAVNLSDGLDGLAAGITFFVALTYVFIAMLLDKGSLASFAAALAGGCLGFLLYNYYPARVFMGDTGSLALGGALAGLAVVTGTELLLVVIGGVYVLEALSVILQVASFRFWGRRLLRMSPLHHHFELIGWQEPRVVTFFWALSFVMGIAGFLIVYL